MALTEFKIAPGLDKQNTSVGANARWVDSDNVRFRYGLPEKVGGWRSPTTDTIVGMSRKLFPFADLLGNKYIAIGTDKFLLLYFEGQYYDITPLDTDRTQLLTAEITTTIGSNSVTITLPLEHGAQPGDIVYFTNVLLIPPATGYSSSDFDNKSFQVISVPTAFSLTINLPTNASGAVTNDPVSMDTQFYEVVGPKTQTYGYGWGTDTWGADGWGDASSSTEVILEPGLWSFDNYGEVLVATINNSKTFTWDPSAINPFTIRASTTTTNFETNSNPTASRFTLVSPTTRHLIHFGTETTIGTSTSQDDMLIRFSNQENINEYTILAVNTAGSQRLQDGTKIMGAVKSKENILVWTDTALYTMRQVGPPFVFGFEQVGTNCGLVGQNAVIEMDGVAYWMSQKGFFLFDGTVKSMSCMVQDYVFDDLDITKGQQVMAGLNKLYNEVIWYYPTNNSEYNDRYVTYNYSESSGVPGGVWYVGGEARSSWIDANLYKNPFGTKFNSTGTGSFPTIIGETGLGQSVFFEHELGNNQVNADGSITAINSYIQSFDFDLDVQGNGEFFLAMRRFVPDFKELTGDAKVTLNIKQYPSQTGTVTALSPFTITSSTTKIDTRARGRFINLKIENDGVNQSWRYGTFRLDLQPDGRR
jgi:hypothetical protein